jgi:hypothetical protein
MSNIFKQHHSLMQTLFGVCVAAYNYCIKTDTDTSIRNLQFFSTNNSPSPFYTAQSTMPTMNNACITPVDCRDVACNVCTAQTQGCITHHFVCTTQATKGVNQPEGLVANVRGFVTNVRAFSISVKGLLVKPLGLETRVNGFFISVSGFPISVNGFSFGVSGFFIKLLTVVTKPVTPITKPVTPIIKPVTPITRPLGFLPRNTSLPLYSINRT